MKITKLFSLIISACMLLSLHSMAVKSDTSWRKGTENPADYDALGYKGPEDKIFIVIDTGKALHPYLPVKFVRTSYEDLIDEIWYTLKHCPSIKEYMTQKRWSRKNLQLWEHTFKHRQTDLTDIAAGSSWYIVDKNDPQTKQHTDLATPAEYDSEGYQGPEDKIFVGVLTGDTSSPYVAVKLVSTSYQDLVDEVWRTLGYEPAIKKYITQQKWSRKNLQLWNRELAQQETDLKDIPAGSRWYIVDKLDPETKKHMDSVRAMYKN